MFLLMFMIPNDQCKMVVDIFKFSALALVDREAFVF